MGPVTDQRDQHHNPTGATLSAAPRPHPGTELPA